MAFSFVSIPNLYFIDDLYQKFIEDPSQVESSWRSFFQGMHLGLSQSLAGFDREKKIYCLIEAYRKYGYLLANFNPLTSPPDTVYELDVKTLGIEKDLNTLFPTCGLLPEKEAPLHKILDLLKETYCSKIGIEYMDLRNPELEKWVQNIIEPYFSPQLDKQQKFLILQDLQRAELFESFLQTKYVGQKRFSLEGAETLIPMLRFLIEQAALSNVEEMVLGMAHRGRLNVLANIVHKDYASIFKEFDENYINEQSASSGDVKYHQGAQGTFTTSLGKDIPVTLVANPSHLESVDPVVEGITYAKLSTKNVIPVLIHGDASFSGQGVVYETLQLCKLKGYQTKGTIHIIINNQIGFTTNPEEGRSTPYCSDLAKTFNCPVFHVNAEDPEGCVWATILSVQIRDTFGCDVFIDLNCYRKYGHNESDEPLFSQPALYKKITKKTSIRTLFSKKMLQENIIQENAIKSLEENFKKQLQEALVQPSSTILKKPQESLALSEIDTKVSLEVLQKIGHRLCMLPDNFNLNPKIKRLLQEREEMLKSDPKATALDWAIAEQLSFASLLFQKISLRFSGQDVCRGTFSHRHAVFVDQLDEKRYFPLSHIAPSQAECTFFNSPLSEYAVLGFEFGVSLAALSSLVIWEAQFGDFVNGAQIILDQYLAPSEQKWGVVSNVVLMLPHGYEGQGPEHSSARIERFLQLAAQDNLRIANCSTPAQLFHLIRAQALASVKKPLILFTPKVLLRTPACKSSLNDLARGHFHEILEDPNMEKNAAVLLFCSGKVYYDLVVERKKQNKQCAIIRLEQLYPFPKEAIEKVLAKHPNARYRFIQEEPSNMGAWESLRCTFDELLGTKSPIEYIGRERSASPATGSYAVHKKQLEDLLKKAFT